MTAPTSLIRRRTALIERPYSCVIRLFQQPAMAGDDSTNVQGWRTWLGLALEQPERFAWRVARENPIDLLTEVVADQFTQHIAEVRSDGQVSPFEKLFGFQTWPAPVDFTATHWTAEHHHHVAVAVVGAAIAVFLHRSAELGHRHENDVFHSIAHVMDECGQRSAELLEQTGQLGSLVRVMVPTTDIGESRLHTNPAFDEPSNLLQAAAKFTVILGAVDGGVRTAFDRLNHLHSFEGSFSLGHELCIRCGRV